MFFYAAFAALGLAAVTCEDRRLEPIFACGLLYLARFLWLPLDDAQFLGGIAALFALCALFDTENWLFHAVSGLFVLVAVSIAANLV